MKRSSLLKDGRAQSMIQGVIRQTFTRYLLVSVAALGLDVSVFTSLLWIEVTSMTLASCLGYLSGLGLSFVLNKRYVFNMQAAFQSVHTQWLAFFITGLIGLAITGLSTFFLEIAWGAHPSMIKASAVVLSFVLVFVLRKFLYSERRPLRKTAFKVVVS